MTDRLLYAALLLVVAMSPFEAGYPPLTRFFRATFTNLEVMLLALTAGCLSSLLPGRAFSACRCCCLRSLS
jgi:hypothetical protein